MKKEKNLDKYFLCDILKPTEEKSRIRSQSRIRFRIYIKMSRIRNTASFICFTCYIRSFNTYKCSHNIKKFLNKVQWCCRLCLNECDPLDDLNSQNIPVLLRPHSNQRDPSTKRELTVCKD
jgi:hypothetical protein